ncbi:MAG: hypothetical protein M1838_000720 [Thelocarpon superellum]|nr:MAG: hypothetical protein M1838_000720 [Thelocarpon superellum]
MTTSEHDALSIEDSRSLQFPARRSRNGSLPADDGQSVLRKRIVEIQETDAPAGEKARLMHLVMTEPYTLLHPNLPLSHLARPQSPASLLSHDRPYTPSSLNSGSGFGPRPSTPTSMSSVQADMAYSLRPEDLEPTYVPNASSAANTRPASSNEINGARDVEAAEPTSPVFGCQHYKRNVKLQCSACQRWYTCRFCHDDVEDHSLNRRETRNMLCMLCGCAQPAAERCVDCDQRAAWYYCSICKLWDDETEKSIYHCTDCGICRVGRGLGKDYFHCSTCCVCMSISIAQSHKCIERSTDCDCPICGEYMFTSPLTVVFMQCGHSIHHKCYYEHMKTSYRCPICSRSIVNMETQFRNLDRSIASQPMPSQFQDTKALVSCNDCSAKSSVKYHWLGSKCGVCDSYNTAQLQILTARHPASRMPAVADEAPGPSTAETRPSPLLSAEATRLSEPPARVPAGPQRRPTSSGHSAARARFSPYIVPQRTGRSISPIPMSNGFLAVPLPQAESIETDTVSMDDEDEEVDFWGRDGRVEDDSEMDDVEDEEDAEEDEEDDDDDDEMELFGHR